MMTRWAKGQKSPTCALIISHPVFDKDAVSGKDNV